MAVQPGQTLSHYRLIEIIGEGGMGVVWKAHDSILNRTVAIKVLPADAALDDRRRQMFVDEARLASSISDAHIVQVHELGRHGDLDFIVMEYVEGRPLSKILHGRSLPPDRVANLGFQVARALSRVHRKGLLHRDLKPANILVTADGDAKVVDFGLATLLANAPPDFDSEAATRSFDGGLADAGSRPVSAQEIHLFGTLPYMSPEQARGEGLDARSDVFSFGVVLYELTTGQRPFTGIGKADILREILKTRPVAPHDLMPKVPLELDRIIQKTLAPKPSDRYQTMEDLAVDLKRLGRDLEAGSSPTFEEIQGRETSSGQRRNGIRAAAAAIVAAVLGVGGWILWSRAGSGTVAPGALPRTILILPMKVRGQTEGADYVGRAFAEAMAVNLARAKGLKVLPVPEAGELRSAGSLSQARVALGVGANCFLTGALTRNGAALHATLNLIDAKENRILWGGIRDVKGDDLGTLAAAMAREVATELGATSPRLYESFRVATGSAAMAASPLTSEALDAARRFDAFASLPTAQRLVEAFPNEPDAHVLLSAGLLLRGFELGPSSPERKAFQDSVAALDRIDPRNPWDEFFSALFLTRDGRYREAVDLFTQVLSRDDLAPSARSLILSMRGQAERDIGESAAALSDLEEALRLDPTNDVTYATLSHTLQVAGRLEEALDRARQAVALNPLGAQNNRGLGLVLYELGRWEESVAPRAMVCQSSRIQSDCALYAASLQRAGRSEEASRAAAEAASLRETYEGAYNLACYRALTGDHQGAIRLLKRAYEIYQGPDPYLSITRDPDLVSLQGDPQFKAIVAELKRRLDKQ